MLTTDKTITTKEYWDGLYKGERNDTPVDSSNGIRPKASFDRFDIVVKHVEGPNVLGVGSGHAHIEKRIKALHPDWIVIASDQSEEARKASGYKSYFLVDAYSINVKDKSYNTLIATQCLEYMEHQDKALTEFKRVAKKFICTIPLN
jgi:ubiquinone/menaquinone biosynthesis C-methylase UbiE